MSHTSQPGTGLPWAAFALGAAGSLAANLIDAYRAAERVGVAANADVAAALFFALIVPVALLLVVEMLIRSGKAGGESRGLAVVMWLGAGVVAAGAAVMSFSHMYAVMLSYGQPPYIAALMPLAVDGLMLVASVALARSGRAVQTAEDAVPVQVTVPEPAVPAAAPAEPAAPVAVPAAILPDMLPLPLPEPAVLPDALPNPGKPAETVPSLAAAAGAQHLAREWVRAALRDGRRVTGAIVGAEFGKSERWGRDRIAEVKRVATQDVTDASGPTSAA